MHFLFRSSNQIALALWQLSSLVHRLSSIYSHLNQQMDLCHQQIGYSSDSAEVSESVLYVNVI